MNRGEEFVVSSKTYELILWSCNHTSRFQNMCLRTKGPAIYLAQPNGLGPYGSTTKGPKARQFVSTGNLLFEDK